MFSNELPGLKGFVSVKTARHDDCGRVSVVRRIWIMPSMPPVLFIRPGGVEWLRGW
jgi:hypothetical protein